MVTIFSKVNWIDGAFARCERSLLGFFKANPWMTRAERSEVLTSLRIIGSWSIDSGMGSAEERLQVS